VGDIVFTGSNSQKTKGEKTDLNVQNTLKPQQLSQNTLKINWRQKGNRLQNW